MFQLAFAPHALIWLPLPFAAAVPPRSAGTVGGSTPFWAAGMPEPLPLASLRELRWWVSRGVAPLSALRAAGVALRVLQALAEQQPALDPHTGEPLFPLPAAHRQMAAPACLPHIAQVCVGLCPQPTLSSPQPEQTGLSGSSASQAMWPAQGGWMQRLGACHSGCAHSRPTAAWLPGPLPPPHPGCRSS